MNGTSFVNVIWDVFYETLVFTTCSKPFKFLLLIGYGVRWSLNDLAFRGFLEPQMVDGHEVGWRH